jgi:glycine/D-amino acid oxidase-like deaminating enzyme
MSRIIVVGAGINGVTAAIELKKRGHEVVLVDPGPLPHPLAASTDISKAVRAAYGPDEDYTELAERCIPIWRKWNEEFGLELYHESGVVFLRRQPMEPGDFEYESCKALEKRGHKFERLDAKKIRARFPAFPPEYFCDGFFDPEAGYVESGRVVAALVACAKSLGVALRDSLKFVALDEDASRVRGIVVEGQSAVIPSGAKRSRGTPWQRFAASSRDPSASLGMTRIAADAVVIAAGAWTPYLLPFTEKFFRATGHPVFHLKPPDLGLFLPERFPFFGADIATTGYYGFPLNHGVVKIANHGPGREMSPDSSQRAVTRDEEEAMRAFLRSTIPALAAAPIVYTRICMYCDTHDGHFWIARDPARSGLVIATGDCGHGFKFAPVLGGIIADAVAGKSNRWLDKFRWRPEVQPGKEKEAARFSGAT